MPSRFSVEWTEGASRDLAEIITYIARDSPSDARRVYQRIRKRADTLRRFPGKGHVVPELASLNVVHCRELLVLPYRIVYRIDKSKVFVLAVFDGRRDLRQVLSERLLRVQ